MISSCLRIDLWIPYYTKAVGLETEFYSHKKIWNMMTTGPKNVVYNLRYKRLLILYGKKEKNIPKMLINDPLDEICKTQKSIEEYDCKCDTLSDSKHDLDDAFMSESMEWMKKWVFPKSTTTEAKMLASL